MKKYLLWAIMSVASCRSSQLVQMPPKSTPDYSIIYVIHGDANYLYHTADGVGRQADMQILKEAKSVAKKAAHGEVFIFHQRPEHKLFLLFPKKDRRYFYFRNGKLIQKGKYSPSSSDYLAAESSIYTKYSKAQAQEGHKILLYFGHEIPVRDNWIYNASRKNVRLTTSTFAAGVASFTQNKSALFDLIVLSTCNNGTPSMVRALSPFTRYVLGSPQNLHLSFIDTGRLSSLLEAHNRTKIIADSLASQTYRRLSSFLQTAITLSVYDTRKAQSYLLWLNRRYTRYLQNASNTDLLRDNTDCAQRAFFNIANDTLGVQTWYCAPRFGIKKTPSTTYSGWGCKKK